MKAAAQRLTQAEAAGDREGEGETRIEPHRGVIRALQTDMLITGEREMLEPQPTQMYEWPRTPRHIL